MSINACFWALLSLDNFKFIHVPELDKDLYVKSPLDILLYQSLLNFVHPDELPSAKADLLSIMKIKPLTGAVTRCRLCKIVDDKKCKITQDWIMTDIIVYGVTSKTLLAFFHSTARNGERCCINKEDRFHEPERLIQSIERYSSPVTLDHLSREFQIYDNKSKQLLVSWPQNSNYNTLLKRHCDVNHPLYPTDIRKTFIEKASKVAVSDVKSGYKSSKFGCSRHTYSNSTATLEPYGLCNIEKIVVHFGSISFLSFEITPSEPYYYPPKADTVRLPSIRKLLNNAAPLPERLDDNRSKQLPPIACISPKDVNSKPVSIKPWQSRLVVLEKKCEHCHTSTSPEWRKGPSGHKTLCNACGLRYARLVAKREKQNTKHMSKPYKKKKQL